jgi:hypothetical protein
LLRAALTPKLEKKVKNNSNQISSRVVGVEVHCGTIHETFFYIVDDMHAKGANSSIDIMKNGEL